MRDDGEMPLFRSDAANDPSASRRLVLTRPRPVGAAGPRHARSGVMPGDVPPSGSPTVSSAESAHSPTTSIGRVLVTLATALLLTLVLGSRGLVHAGSGMPDGPMRSATLAVGHALFRTADATRLVWPWDRFESALGRAPQPENAPMLAASSEASAVSIAQPAVRAGVRPVVYQSRRAGGQPPATRRVLSRARLVRGATKPVDPAGPSVRHELTRPTAGAPLRLLVTGDSLTEFLGPTFVNEAAQAGPVRGLSDTHYGTGLARPDFVDWSVLARQQVAADHPQAIVVFMGGNDFQNMTLPNGTIVAAATPPWTREYQRRAAICMRIWAQGGRARVYWLSIPPARSDTWAHANAQMDLALKRAASQVRGAEYLDIRGPVTDHGSYADFVTPPGGVPVLVREPDGIHLTRAGSTMVAHEVLAVVRREWHL